MSSKKWSTDELKEHLNNIYEEHGTVTTTLTNETDGPVASLYYQRFDSFEDALREAGIDDVEVSPNGRSNHYSDDELLELLREVYEDEGEINNTVVERSEKTPVASVYYDRFGGLRDACEMIGVEYKRRLPEKYSRENMLETLRRVEREHGSVNSSLLGRLDYVAHPTVYYKKFGGVKDACREAGVEYKRKEYKRMDDDDWEMFESTVDDIDQDADGHLYILRLADDRFYVGETTNFRSRFQTHVRDKDITEVLSVVPMYKASDESDYEFRQRLRRNEQETICATAIKYDTVNVIGG